MTRPSLVEFLTARLDEDEAAATDALTRDHWSYDGYGEFGPFVSGAGVETEDSVQGQNIANYLVRVNPWRVLADVKAKRAIVERESVSLELVEWTPDCGGDWCLSGGATAAEEPGIGYFANYWPDNTVSASVYVDGEDVANSGIVARRTKAECMSYAEDFVREHLPNVSPTLRVLASVYADHPDYDATWAP